jgi:hypothetical protein
MRRPQHQEGGRQQALGEVVTGSSSPWTPAAEGRGGDQRLVLYVSPPPVMRRRENRPARAPPTGRVRRLASPSIPHPRSHRPPGGRVAAAGSDPFARAHLPGRQEEGIGASSVPAVDWIMHNLGEIEKRSIFGL